MRHIRRYTTESGSTYTIDWTNKLWHRKQGKNGAVIRNPQSGKFIEGLATKESGVYLVLPPIVEGAAYRFIQSTAIEKYESLMYCKNCGMLDRCSICGADTHCAEMEDTYMENSR